MLYDRKQLVLYSLVVLFYSSGAYPGGGGGDLHTCPKSLLHSPYLRTYNGHCYEFKLDGGLSWVEAESACRNHGGHLVSVNSPEERQFLLTTLFSMWFHGDYVLIGLTDSKREGTFVWSSGETTSFMDWAYGQPDQYIHGKKRFLVPIPPVPREEDCVGMRFKDWGHWHDVPCDRPFISPYICEYAPTTHVPTKTTSVTMTPLASTTTPTRHAETSEESIDPPKTTVATVPSTEWVTLGKRGMLSYWHLILNKHN
uniref:C-type lectin domain-containing protein n=2 Tax=Magallana gigas TaxID=29159 RepID=A0A8W8KAK5_MAGGI|nr:C-type lectin lectoxin-Enh4-like isoform X4 [Crassostrea gigas]XP_034337416.1 C-type lectin lectoxin-Enh4-like isoform X4 [Crassostrea gigas]XP_034337417.1 C-type lectin lectoxin-Enh4-like isoform X4 [Crassostrea gigas]